MRAKRFNIDWIYSGSFSEEVILKDPKDELETQRDQTYGHQGGRVGWDELGDWD